MDKTVIAVRKLRQPPYSSHDREASTAAKHRRAAAASVAVVGKQCSFTVGNHSFDSCAKMLWMLDAEEDILTRQSSAS